MSTGAVSRGGWAGMSEKVSSTFSPARALMTLGAATVVACLLAPAAAWGADRRVAASQQIVTVLACLLYTSPSPRD